MAESEVPRSSLSFPRLDRPGFGGESYWSGRGCRELRPAREPGPRRPAAGPAGEVVLRPAGLADLAAAREMHARCSPRTLAGRYQGAVTAANSYLPHLLSPRFGRSLAARAAGGRLVGLGHLLWDEGAEGELEVALLVEDAWQRRRIGTRLLRSLLSLAARERHEVVYAVTPAANAGMMATMRATGLPLERRVEAGAEVLSLRLREPVGSAPPRPGPWRAHGLP
ncbi:GNAT family N-acetyltransferase [Streptomyces hoynatensis]|uniref:GNAT family N-acetyltransferase n=1 Tax=Streptomyces hoynatensis TaxID=1141874 RepID=A0A3A9Z999_9ACTN|nr:GNAT family N-acetyltransferase [Streptomyces hoynatensis]